MRSGTTQTSITIRNLEPGIKQRLRLRAARHGHSMEAEARAILYHGLVHEPGGGELNLAEAIRRRMAPLGGVELEAEAREPAPEPPCFK